MGSRIDRETAALGSAPGSGGRLPQRRRAVRYALGRRPLARRAQAGGSPPGPAAGHWEPVGRSTGENPADTLVRELREESAVSPERVRGEALVRLPRPAGHVRRTGVARRRAPTEAVTPDHEHDAFAWWPRAIDSRPTGGRRATAADGALAVGVSPHADGPGAAPVARGVPVRHRVAGHPAAFTHVELDIVLPLSACICACSRARSRLASPGPPRSCSAGPRAPLDHDVGCVYRGASSLRFLCLAVAVAVLGGLGPFFGGYRSFASSAGAVFRTVHPRAERARLTDPDSP